MREIWAIDGHDRLYCPCLIKDNGAAVDDSEVLPPKISFFSQPDSGYGEKSVSHITVTDHHVYQPDREVGYKRPTRYFTDDDRYGWVKTNTLMQSALNEMIVIHWRGDSSSEPEQANWFIKIKYTRPTMYIEGSVVFVDREWWCSPSYAQEYYMGGTHGTDHSTLLMYKASEGHDLMKRYALTPELARSLYNSVACAHTVPGGLMSELYRNAMNSITCNTNSIANALEVVDIIKDVKQGNIGALVSDIPDLLKKKQFKKTVSSAWLGYRYAYNTTKSDIEEYKEKLLPLFDQKSGTHIVRSGQALEEGVAHCKVVYSDRALNAAQKLYVNLKRTGLCLDAYSIWDMIPLSFVADWFLPIGDFLEDFSQNWVANSAIFDIATVTTSWKWQHTIRDNCGWYDISYYSRTVTTEPPEFESYSEDPSTKTILKRVVDAAALIVG